jgi:hypothetical protein
MSTSKFDEEFEIEVNRVVVTVNHLTVDFADGRTISVPTAWYPRLASGTPSEWANVEIWSDGLHWEDLNESVSFKGLILGMKSGESPKSFAKWLSHRARGEREPILELPMSPALAKASGKGHGSDRKRTATKAKSRRRAG